MFDKPNSKQLIDDRCGLVFPWYVPLSLEFFLINDVGNWDIFEWGGGLSSAWYAYNAKYVDILETNEKWTKEIDDYIKHKLNKNNYSIKYIDVKSEEAEYGSQNIPTPNMELYLSYISTLNKTYDCIIIDGSYRDEAIIPSIQYVKNGGYIIFDNYEQVTSGYSTLKNKDLLNRYDSNIYTEGDWKTGIWRIYK
jgi:hypothetical protein